VIYFKCKIIAAKQLQLRQHTAACALLHPKIHMHCIMGKGKQSHPSLRRCNKHAAFTTSQ
jgi:hypothetical protein